MRFHFQLIGFLGSIAYSGTCPFLGPAFPTPKSLSASTSFQSALSTLRINIDTAFSTGNSAHGLVNPNDTYSVQIFSTKANAPLLEYHHRGVNVLGNKSLNGDSVYRIASTTKLFTVYLLLLQAGDDIFNDPVPKYLPELAGKQHWDEITIGALAGYVGGIVSDLYGNEGSPGGGIGDAFPEAFPTLAPDEISPCVYNRTGCTRQVFLDAIITRRSVYLPNTTPAYTNAAFATLGLVLESATGISFAENLHKFISEPLNLNGTTVSAPSDSSRGVIVGDESAIGWNLVLDGAGIGMGAIFSTANDLSAVGRAILASSLLPKNTTRAWLQPTAFTSSLIGAIGRPWEIFRAIIGPAGNNRVVDLYTKGGNVAGYGANFVLIPDYNVGFVVLQAGRRGRVPIPVSGIIVDELLPALEEAARVEADAAFAGTYTVPGSLNSSLTLSTTSGIPGLSIDRWISNGTDLVRDVFGSPESFQMYPTNIESEDRKQVSWRSSFISFEDTGAFSACPSWGAIDRPTYGVYGVDEFVFYLGDNGKVTGVEPKALKIVFERV